MLAITLAIAIATNGERLDPSHCDRLELNQVIDWCGDRWQPRLLQWIYWDWDARRCCWVVREWEMCRTDARPMRCGTGWILPLYRAGRLVILHSDTYSPTWTINDPEVDNRDVLPSGRRRALPW